MLEKWNSGIAGSGLMQCWINGPSTGGMDDKIKMAIILIENQYTSVPPFHYSTFGANSETQKCLNILNHL
jgi:hypothetical protein